MTQLAAWQVDPAWPAVPDLADDELDLPEPERRQADLLADDRAALYRQVAGLRLEGLRLQLRLHHAQRSLAAQPAPPPAPARRRGGKPSQPARNDRLLALYEATPDKHSRLQRCRLAAQRYAAEVAESAGLDPSRARVLPVTTARDAIAEARRRQKR